MSEDSGFKKDKLIKKIRANGFSQLLKGLIRTEVSTHTPNDLENKKILLVDDEQEICAAVKEILSGITENISMAYHAKEAIEFIEKEKFDLFILDIQMPGFNGLQLLEHLRSKNIDTPVLFLSASSSEKNLEIALNLSASAFIEKPFEADELIDVASRLVEYGHTMNQKTKKG